jgi:uncharacterized protein YjbI with pentapeptide repeats
MYEINLDTEQQDIECDAWKRLLELVEVVAEDEREAFAPGREMGWDDWHQIITLPATISKLKSVKHLMLGGSNLVRIPPEIGEMTNLETFNTRHSYRLHWFPYEITRCKKLKDSKASTRVLYGNYKFHLPFPKLPVGATVEAGSPTKCSVCNAPISASNLHQVWVSLWVATDVLPLLVNACSKVCIDKLPRPDYTTFPSSHRYYNLYRADFRGADLSGAVLRGVNLNCATLRGANLNRADLRGADLRGADLSRADLRGANLSRATLRGADLRGANLNRATLRGANLKDADISLTSLSRAKLRDAFLNGADLRGADLNRAYLKGAILSESTQLDSKWRLVWEIVNQGAEGRDLSHTDLSYTDLYDANLTGAKLVTTQLIGADLSRANLIGAELRNAILIGANLRAANLSGTAVESAEFGYNKGISASMRRDLIDRGAIFEDSPSDRFLELL